MKNCLDGSLFVVFLEVPFFKSMISLDSFLMTLCKLSRSKASWPLLSELLAGLSAFFQEEDTESLSTPGFAFVAFASFSTLIAS